MRAGGDGDIRGTELRGVSEVAITENAEGATFAVRVHPGARRTGIKGEHDGALKLELQTPPVDGRANEALVEFVAKWLGVAKGAVTIVSGEHARSKRVRVAGMTAERVREKIAAEMD